MPNAIEFSGAAAVCRVRCSELLDGARNASLCLLRMNDELEQFLF